MVAFGSKLRLERIRRGISQTELSRRAGVPQANLSNIENGKQDITVGTLLQICAALGIQPSSVLDTATHRPDRSRFSRAELEAIAASAVGDRLPAAGEQKEIALLLRKVMLQGAGRRISPKEAVLRWDELRRRLTDEEIEALRQRVEDALQRNANAKKHR